jgi:tRNA(Ile)-lysidine synthetase-like protein
MAIIEQSPSELGQDKFLQEFLKFIRSRELCAAGDSLLLACSGGLDSTVLLHLMSRAQRLLNLKIEVAHVDHGLRGLASRQEGVWVKSLAGRYELETHLVEIEKVENPSQDKLRSLRRGRLIELAAKRGLSKIVTAHHASDNAETFLMRAVSGTGVSGLAGVSPKDRIWIRPLLWATRDDLENYARTYSLGWVEDPSNARGDYFRNQIRLEIIPKLEELRPGSVRNLARISLRVEEEEREWEKWIEDQLEAPYETLPRAWVEKWPDPLQRRIFKVWIQKLGLDYEPQLVEALVNGEEVIHTRGSFLKRSDFFIFSRERDFGAAWTRGIPVELGKTLPLGVSTAWSFLKASTEKFRSLELAVSFNFRPPSEESLKNKLSLAWDKIPWPLMIRAREESDLGAEFDKILAQNKIPRPFWKNWPLIVSAQNPKQVIGFVGVEILPEFRLTNLGRCVSMECFLKDYLKVVSPS